MSHRSSGRLSRRGVRPHLGRQQRQSTARSRGRKELRGQKKNTGCKDIDDALHNGNFEVGVQEAALLKGVSVCLHMGMETFYRIVGPWRPAQCLRVKVEPPREGGLSNFANLSTLTTNLQVCDIVDVTNFVHPGTPLDDEATQRGTSVYLVERQIDMLPKPLTEANVERLAFSVIWEMTPEAKIISTRFTKSVIKSCAALSYVEAQARMDDSHLMDPLTTDLRNMNVLAKVMRQRRIDRGALTLASAEVKFQIDTETHDPLDIDVATTMILTLGPVIDFLLANQNALEPRNINWAKQLKVREAEKNQCKDIVRSEKTNWFLMMFGSILANEDQLLNFVS
ncbi:hypothetical protein HYC85_013841 [Camellia sinensis]|uniref:RNB domain-containing protein n=1 Tax=Camellia sinensis TaxID=4442 RepID=A0A7J7H7N7_CAMSI|nr:hypothetical protein HYC85_013841 [Camellia sinensis]